MLVEVSEDELADNFAMVHTRKQLLQTALGFYQDFIEQKRGDAASQADLAAVEQHVKGILRELELLRRDVQTGLLRNRAVVQELRLDTKQSAQVAETMNRWVEEWQSLRSEIERLDEDSKRHRMAEMAEERELWLAQVLSETQRLRLSQLLLQWQGLWAFKEPDVVDALALTSEQRAAIRKIERERHDRNPGHDHGPQDRRDRRTDLKPPDHKPSDHRPPDKQQAVAKVLALLSSEQLEHWRRLTGEPVEGLNDHHDAPPAKEPRGERGSDPQKKVSEELQDGVAKQSK